MYNINSLSELQHFTHNFAQELINSFFPVLLLSGNLGSGKTTFAHFLLEHLQVDTNVEISSPSFTLYNIYPCKHFIVHHYDLYRTNSETFLEDLSESFEQKNCFVIVEWPEHLHYDNYPLDGVLVQLGFDVSKNIRYANLTAINTLGKLFVNKFSKYY